jgi:hypothetical protein
MVSWFAPANPEISSRLRDQVRKLSDLIESLNAPYEEAGAASGANSRLTVVSHAAGWHDPSDPEGEATIAPATISVAVYLDTDDRHEIEEVLSAVDSFVSEMGYEGPSSVYMRRGSIFRRSIAVVKRGLKSREVAERLLKVERALEIAALDSRQAAVDSQEAEAVARLLASLSEIERACIRAGSILLIKFPGQGGQSVILVRNLSQREIRMFERYPEIQSRPESVLEALGTAMSEMAIPLE